MHEPLDAVIELDEDAECGHAADDALVGLADELRHVLDFLHIRGLALRLDRDALTRRGVLRRLRQDGAQLLTTLRRDMPRGERLAQEAVYHEIGIAADGRGEMRVVARRKTEMPEALRAVACLLHGAQGNRPDDAFLGFPLDLIEHALNVARADLAVLVDVQAQTERREETLEPLDFLAVWLLVHTVDERFFLQLHMARDRLVRDEHTLLDDGFAEGAGALLDGDGMPLCVELDLDLREFKVDRASAVTLCTQRIAQMAQRLEHGSDVRIIRDERLFAREHLVDERVGEPARNVNDARHDLVALYLTVRANLHFARHRETIHALVETAYAVREFLREHRNDTVDEIDARSAPRRLHIERLARANIVTDIRDVDPEEESAVLLIRIDAVVDVLRILAVDRNDGEIAPITPPRILLGERVLRTAHRSRRDLYGEFLIEVIGAHHGEHIDARIARGAEHLHHAPLGAAALLRPLRNLDDDLTARLRAVKILFQDKYVAPDLRAVGRDEAERLAALERADNPRIHTLEDTDDLSLSRAPRLLGRRDARHDAVAVHRGRKSAAGHEHVRLFLRIAYVGDDEPEPLRRHGEPPYDEVHAARHAVEPAAVADDGAVCLKCRQSLGKARYVLPDAAQSCRQFILLQRAIGVLPHKGADAFFHNIQLFLFHNFLVFPFLSDLIKMLFGSG